MPNSETRREWLRRAAMLGTAGMSGRLIAADEGDAIELPFANGKRPLVKFPQKRELMLVTRRPPQLETPFPIFNDGIITPNDAFFVRYHLANIPLKIDDATFRCEVRGGVKTPLSLSIEDLKKNFEQVEITAVCQCSGNSRGFFTPRVGGGQLGNGAMGNAKWRGVRLKDVLEKAGLAAEAKQVSFNGLDKPAVEKTPDFIKSLDLEQIMAGDVILAHTMNGEPLPMLNGFPLRVVVPGYYATYWVKHVNEITVLSEPLANFWMATAYRIPNTEGACIEPGTTPKSTVPISKMNVRSFITSHGDGANIKVGAPVTVRGVAFDGGEGIKEVQFSADGGKSWSVAELGADAGKYSFREWKFSFTPAGKGSLAWKVRAFNRVGQSQPLEPLWNPAGYMRNVVETVNVNLIS
ncbi:MAG: molybdopterin-dependent oxidoreductase [Verrucomicrobia bacterium]|nr:molybdopterin-dependent oxidoreductase [Verrucomicrobiota bacterium]